MNAFEKNIAQLNGEAYGLPAVYTYVREYIPIDTDVSSAVDMGNYYQVTTKHLSDDGYRHTTTTKNIHKRHFQLVYPFYYDDPDETEEERIKIVESVEYDSDVLSHLRGNVDKYMHALIKEEGKNLLNSYTHAYLVESYPYYARLSLSPRTFRASQTYTPIFSYE
ncbi:hypothetical protein ACTQ54_03150 [Fundicoccus sp. Sow4_H7]|uniref:hypothetical protein n=1 Tax=Fundicoccus sp. Sow4_H7 TaxID=3438784 RepID=UPI003F9327D0